MIEAKDIKRITKESKGHFDAVMERIEMDAILRANEGRSDAYITVDETIKQKIKEELVLCGYTVNEESPTRIKISW